MGEFTFEYPKGTSHPIPDCGLCREPIKGGEAVAMIPHPSEVFRKANPDATREAHAGCAEGDGYRPGRIWRKDAPIV
jgi:hypothetical protein